MAVKTDFGIELGINLLWKIFYYGYQITICFNLPQFAIPRHKGGCSEIIANYCLIVLFQNNQKLLNIWWKSVLLFVLQI